MTFDPTFLSSFVLVLTGFGGAFLAALWIALVIWTYRDIRAHARDPLVHILSALLVAVLNLPGVLVYLIFVPQERWKRNTSIHLKKRPCFNRWRICRFVRAASGVLKRIGRSAQIAIPN